MRPTLKLGRKGANMKWKNRLTNYNFWISIASASLLILRAFDVKMDIANINEIVTAVLGLLVMIGIVNDPTRSSKDDQKTTQKNASQTTKESNVEDVMPSVKQDENDIVAAENALQMLVDKISADIKNNLEVSNQFGATKDPNLKLNQEENIQENIQPEQSPQIDEADVAKTEDCPIEKTENDEQITEITSCEPVIEEHVELNTQIQPAVEPEQNQEADADQKQELISTCFNIVN